MSEIEYKQNNNEMLVKMYDDRRREMINRIRE